MDMTIGKLRFGIFICFLLFLAIFITFSQAYAGVANDKTFYIYASKFDLTLPNLDPDTSKINWKSDDNPDNKSTTKTPLMLFVTPNDEFSEVTQKDIEAGGNLIKYKNDRIFAHKGDRLVVTFIGRKDYGNCAKDFVSIDTPTQIQSAFLLGLNKIADSTASILMKMSSSSSSSSSSATKSSSNNELAEELDLNFLTSQSHPPPKPIISFCYVEADSTLKDNRDKITIEVKPDIDKKSARAGKIALLLKKIYQIDTAKFRIVIDNFSGNLEDAEVKERVAEIKSTVAEIESTNHKISNYLSGTKDDIKNQMADDLSIQIDQLFSLIDNLSDELSRNPPTDKTGVNGLIQNLYMLTTSGVDELNKAYTRIIKQLNDLRTLAENQALSSNHSSTTKSLTMGQSDHVFWSGDAILRPLRQYSLNKSTGDVTKQDKSGLGFLGINYMLGDMYDDRSSFWESIWKGLVFKGMFSVTSKPFDALGAGIGYRFKDNFGFYDSSKSGSFMIFVAYFYTKGDNTSKQNEALRFGISYDLGTALGWFSK